MAEMIATTLALGDPAPAFALRDTAGAEHVVPPRTRRPRRCWSSRATTVPT